MPHKVKPDRFAVGRGEQPFESFANLLEAPAL